MHRPPDPADLRAAAAIVLRDGGWWWQCLLHGALALSIAGLPLAVGFIMESYDNSRRGYPTPLPPWSDWTLRGLTGVFALLIDLLFFLLPALVGGMLLACAGLGLLVAGQSTPAALALAGWLTGGLAGGLALIAFASSAAPAGRLIFADEGQIERALSLDTLRWALAAPRRRHLARARLASLAAYLPAALLAAATLALARTAAPAQPLLVLVGVWLTLSAGVFAQLIGAQLYVGAERIAARL